MKLKYKDVEISYVEFVGDKAAKCFFDDDHVAEYKLQKEMMWIPLSVVKYHDVERLERHATDVSVGIAEWFFDKEFSGVR